MKVVSEITTHCPIRHAASLAIGVFDGIHRGHQHVLNRAITYARRTDGQAWVLTFIGHPRRLLSPKQAPPLLTSLPHKLHLLNDFKIDGCLVLPFTRQLAGFTPSRFVKLLTIMFPGLTRIFVGSNWRFGCGGSGNPHTLAQFGLTHGFSVDVIPPVRLRGMAISSTRIRGSVINGRLAEARAMLGRPFSVMGKVITGRGIGRNLGFPTANISVVNEVLPPSGVYAVMARIKNNIHGGVANIGTRPTFHATEISALPLTLEVHLFDMNPRLLGHILEVYFIRKLRSEHRFASHHDLIRQMHHDSERARRILSTFVNGLNSSGLRNAP